MKLVMPATLSFCNKFNSLSSFVHLKLPFARSLQTAIMAHRQPFKPALGHLS